MSIGIIPIVNESVITFHSFPKLGDEGDRNLVNTPRKYCLSPNVSRKVGV
jgi:hypothetical protein